MSFTRGDEPLTMETLARFERLLAQQDPSFVEFLRPGLTEVELDRALEPLGLDREAIGEDAVTWWQWHDGIGPHALLERPIGYLGFAPLGDAVVNTAFFRSEMANEVYPDRHDSASTRTLDMTIQSASEEIGWTFRSLIVLEQTNGDVIVLDTAASGRPMHYKGVTGSMSPRPIAGSLGELIRHWIGRLERGAPAGDLDADPVRAPDDLLRIYPHDGV